MKKESRFYLIFLLIFTVLSALIFLCQKGAGVVLIHADIWNIQLFFFVVTLLAHFISSKGLKKVEVFHLYYMASLTVRFLLCIGFILIYLLLGHSELLIFVVDFFILYFVYTSFEIYFLLRNLQVD